MLNILRYFKTILGWRNWAVFTYNSFIENIFIVFFIALAAPDFSNNFLWNILFFYLFSIFSTSYGYLVNDLADVELDSVHNKPNTFIGEKKSTSVFCVCSALLFSAIFALPFLRKSSFLILWMIWLFLTTFYSLKPFRFKEKGKFGLVIVVFAQRLLPTLLVFAAFSYSEWIDVIIFSLYVLFRGLSSDVNHQLEDYKFDSQTKTTTFVVTHGFEKTRRIFVYLLRIERILFLIILFKVCELFNNTSVIFSITSWVLFIWYTFMWIVVELQTFRGIILNPFSKNEKNVVQFIHHPFPTILLPLFLSLFIAFKNKFFFIVICILISNKIIYNKSILTDNFIFLLLIGYVNRKRKKLDQAGSDPLDYH